MIFSSLRNLVENFTSHKRSDESVYNVRHLRKGKPVLERQVNYAFFTTVLVLILILFAVESQSV